MGLRSYARGSMTSRQRDALRLHSYNFTQAMVCAPPRSFSQGMTTSTLGTPDYELALKQHEAYCRALEQCGLTLINLSPDEDYPDSTFVEDTAVANRFHAVLTRPGAPSRAGEVESMGISLSMTYSSVHKIEAPGTLDGGDVCETNEGFFIGISQRTNEAGAQQLADFFAGFNYPTILVDVRSEDILHLKSGLAYLGDDRLAVTKVLARRPEFQDYELVRVSDDEAYAANCVRINDYVLIASGNPEFTRKLHRLGYETKALDMSEFQKMDGGLSCLSLRL